MMRNVPLRSFVEDNVVQASQLYLKRWLHPFGRAPGCREICVQFFGDVFEKALQIRAVTWYEQSTMPDDTSILVKPASLRKKKKKPANMPKEQTTRL